VRSQSTQRAAADVGGKAGRQHQSKSSARTKQRDRPLDEQLVLVAMAFRLSLVDAGVTRKSHQRPDIIARTAVSVGAARVGPHHVPGRVADDRVEAGGGQALAAGIEKDLGKFQLPVKEPLCCGDSRGLVQATGGATGRHGARATEQQVAQRAER
jgi:hypothetical protein